MRGRGHVCVASTASDPKQLPLFSVVANTISDPSVYANPTRRLPQQSSPARLHVLEALRPALHLAMGHLNSNNNHYNNGKRQQQQRQHGGSGSSSSHGDAAPPGAQDLALGLMDMFCRPFNDPEGGVGYHCTHQHAIANARELRQLLSSSPPPLSSSSAGSSGDDDDYGDDIGATLLQRGVMAVLGSSRLVAVGVGLLCTASLVLAIGDAMATAMLLAVTVGVFRPQQQQQQGAGVGGVGGVAGGVAGVAGVAGVGGIGVGGVGGVGGGRRAGAAAAAAAARMSRMQVLRISLFATGVLNLGEALLRLAGGGGGGPGQALVVSRNAVRVASGVFTLLCVAAHRRWW